MAHFIVFGILKSMSFGKKGPYILIVLLVIILIFILGVQYGKRVKVADTAISFLLSITPIPSSKPLKMPITTFTSYTHKGCKTGFLYPSYLKLEKESTQEAKFVSTDKRQFIKIICNKNLTDLSESTKSATVSINGFSGKSFDSSVKVNNETITSKIIRVNRSSLPVEFTLNTELAPLITTSIELE